MHPDPPPARVRKAILPAAGLGTRLQPLSHILPKELLPVGRKVVLQYVLEECDAAGLDQLLVVGSRRKPGLADAAAATPAAVDPVTQVPRRAVYFASQEQPLGLAHALLHGEAFVGRESFAVALADTILDGGDSSLLARLITAHLEHGAAATIATEEVDLARVPHYGILEPEGEVGPVFRVRRIVEKPAPAAAPSRQAVAARYVFTAEIFAACRAVPRNAAGEIELTEAISWLAHQGRPVVAVNLAAGEERLDIGNLASYSAAFLRKAIGESAPAARSPPRR
jgi:UTP--glucose-1-phosphate uridylyltransferase